MKSQEFISPNVQEGISEEICSKLGIQVTTNIGKYLEFPINHTGAARNWFNFVVDRVMNKFAGGRQSFYPLQGGLSL